MASVQYAHTANVSRSVQGSHWRDHETSRYTYVVRLVDPELSSVSPSPVALKFIEKMCLCSLPLPEESVPVQGQPAVTSVLESWQCIIDDNLPHTEESIREAAVSALTHICTHYYCIDPVSVKKAQGIVCSKINLQS